MSQILGTALHLSGDAKRTADLQSTEAQRRAEEAALFADVQADQDKAAKRHRRNDRQALLEQVRHSGRAR